MSIRTDLLEVKSDMLSIMAEMKERGYPVDEVSMWALQQEIEHDDYLQRHNLKTDRVISPAGLECKIIYP